MTTYLHTTFENGQTALFRPDDRVWVCDWLSDDGEYYSGEEDGDAEDVLKPGVYVLEREYPHDACDRTLYCDVLSRVKSVRKLWQ